VRIYTHGDERARTHKRARAGAPFVANAAAGCGESTM